MGHKYEWSDGEERVQRSEPTATGGLQGAEVDLAPLPRTRQTASRDPTGGVGKWCKSALQTPLPTPEDYGVGRGMSPQSPS